MVTAMEMATNKTAMGALNRYIDQKTK